MSGLLLALLGILAPVIWRSPAGPVQAIPPADMSPKQPAGYGDVPPSTGKSEPIKPREAAPPKDEPRGIRPLHEEKLPDYASLWPFSPLSRTRACDPLARLEDIVALKQDPSHCRMYPMWIAFLSLEPSSRLPCKVETAFRSATQGIEKHSLCGRGYAFLAAYYTYKGLLDRARSFLAEAAHRTPKDSWVRLAQAFFYDKAALDKQKAARILEGLLQQDGSFQLVRYSLARIYIEIEEYGKAEDLFQELGEAFPQQTDFLRVRRSLASFRYAPYYSKKRVQGLLRTSRSLTRLREYPLAAQLCRKVLDEMPGALSRSEQKAALYDLGQIYEVTGEKEMAYACYRNVLQIDPFFRDARERVGCVLKGDTGAS